MKLASRPPIRSDLPPSRSLRAHLRLFTRHGEQQRAIRQQAARACFMERHDVGVGQLVRCALIGAARIDEAIADHPLARFHGWQDGLLDMVAPRGGNSSASVRVLHRSASPESRAADRLGTQTAARLARQQDGVAARFQCRRQRPRLRRLADALPAFQRDEAAACPFVSRRRTGSRSRARAKPPSETASLAASGNDCGVPSPASTTRCATTWPLAIGAFSGPSSGDLGLDLG